MPSGKTHIKINWVVLVLINILIITFGQDTHIKQFFLFNVCFILTSYFISPDLDTNSSVYRRWGIFRIFWYSYRKLMKHRGVSHSIIWGPISILINLTPLLLPVILIFGGIYGHILDIVITVTFCVVYIIEIHIFADKIF